MAFTNEKISSSFFRAEVHNSDRRHLRFATDLLAASVEESKNLVHGRDVQGRHTAVLSVAVYLFVCQVR
ncbi:hypothetical protein DPMN_118087 [Dreissena polymorpha]|uniref:Uncharacterized protein n=1 Tax=Dreissena polymorpha TaxID=45954 RepID=A0A9D4GJJ1_DREPO|nr:hypothetical protein DPMN_118087 [Dreissena polymorpha]